MMMRILLWALLVGIIVAQPDGGRRSGDPNRIFGGTQSVPVFSSDEEDNGGVFGGDPDHNCAILFGCYLEGDNGYLRGGGVRNEVPQLGHYTVICEPDGPLDYLQYMLADTGERIEEHHAPYTMPLTLDTCEERVRFTVSGHVGNSAPCFQRDYILQGPDCVEDCLRKCPDFSHSIHHHSSSNVCIKDPLYDCECDYGYVRHPTTGHCVPECNTQCPPFSSTVLPPGSCIQDPLYDCECDYGYIRQGYQCVPEPVCHDCPAGSRPKNTHVCVHSFADCVCYPGYDRYDTYCAERPKCPHFPCPDYSFPKDKDRCVYSFDDCQCHEGYHRQDAEGYCYPLCQSTYTCPRWSDPKRDCVTSFHDCHCRGGRIKDPSGASKCIQPCSYSYTCPDFSDPIVNCVESFHDCRCRDGYIKARSGAPKCVKPCTHHYQCPANSDRIPGKGCYDSFSDCQCRSGYERNEAYERCERPCRRCPRYATAKVDCVQSISRDCVCDHGYQLDRATRRCVEICDTYTCPAYASRKSGVQCIRAPADCVCDHGYHWDSYSGSCQAVQQCTNSFKCPDYSRRIPGRDCYDSFEDCACSAGYRKDTYRGKCVRTVVAPPPPPPPAPCHYRCPNYSYRRHRGGGCPRSFADCVCTHGYAKHKTIDKCVWQQTWY